MSADEQQAKTEFVSLETAVFKAVMEHLGCSLQVKKDETRMLIYCRECCHSYNIPFAEHNAILTTELSELQVIRDALQEQNETLLDKIGALSCACGYDFPKDICAHHSPQIKKLQEENALLKRSLEQMKGAAK